MADHKSLGRRQRIKIAMDETVDGETITIDEMMVVMGLSKPSFVNLRDQVDRAFGFPKVLSEGRKHFYPRQPALQALLNWETRGDQASADKDARMRKLLGISDSTTPLISISDLEKASRLRAEIDQRLVDQGKLVAVADLQRTASLLYSVFSRPLSNLGTVLDPNGTYPAKVREGLDKLGKDLLLRMHKELGDKLAPNVEPDQPERSKPARAGSGKPRVPPKPRDGGAGVPKSARQPKAAGQRVDKRVGKRAPADQGKKRARGQVVG